MAEVVTRIALELRDGHYYRASVRFDGVQKPILYDDMTKDETVGFVARMLYTGKTPFCEAAVHLESLGRMDLRDESDPFTVADFMADADKQSPPKFIILPEPEPTTSFSDAHSAAWLLGERYGVESVFFWFNGCKHKASTRYSMADSLEACQIEPEKEQEVSRG